MCTCTGAPTLRSPLCSSTPAGEPGDEGRASPEPPHPALAPCGGEDEGGRGAHELCAPALGLQPCARRWVRRRLLESQAMRGARRRSPHTLPSPPRGGWMKG